MRIIILTLSVVTAAVFFDSLTAEEKVLRQVLWPQPKQPALASAALANPVAVLVVGKQIFASEFRKDRVVVSSTASRRQGQATRWRVFADRGPHCWAEGCAILDGAWGLASYDDSLLVASFGSDQVLIFDTKGQFRSALGGAHVLDSPEGLVVRGQRLVVASFLDSKIVQLDLATGDARPLAAGVPIEVDIEAGDFRPRRDRADAEARLWGEKTLELPPSDHLRGPENLVLAGDQLFVSSLHNDTLLALNAATLRLENVYTGLDGPLGLVALDSNIARPFRAALNKPHANAPLLLIASYRGDHIIALDLDDATLDPLPLADPRLQGPSAIAVDPRHPEALYVACYDTGALLYFNVSVGNRAPPQTSPSAPGGGPSSMVGPRNRSSLVAAI